MAVCRSGLTANLYNLFEQDLGTIQQARAQVIPTEFEQPIDFVIHA
jgi:hypothetical protein